MKKRGRIIRDCNIGPGLIGSEGEQFEFQLEGVWKSESAPVINTVVEFELDETKKVIAVTTVSENQLAKEQADKALQVAKETGGAALNELISRVGMPVLIATAVVAISWFFLSALTIEASQYNVVKISFWKLLTVLNLSNEGMLQGLQHGGASDTGMYGFLAFISILGPFVFQFWKNPKAHLCNCLPLLMMLFVLLSFYFGIQDGIKASRQLFAGAEASRMMSGMMNEILKTMMQAIHIGLGMYLSGLASAYLAFIGVKKFLAAKA